MALALGSEPLKPEKSVNYSFGFTFTQGPVTLTADAYQIAIKDRITKTSSLYGPAVSALLISQGFDGNQWVQYYTNAIDTRTRGLDVVADWSRGPFGVTLRTTRYGKVATIADLPTGDRWFGAKWITDLALGADLTPKLKLTIGAENLLDVRPSPNAIPDSAGSALYGSAPFSPQGGFYYSRLSYSF